LRRALAVKPQDRYATAAEFKAGLDVAYAALIDSEDVAARVPAPAPVPAAAAPRREVAAAAVQGSPPATFDEAAAQEQDSPHYTGLHRAEAVRQARALQDAVPTRVSAELRERALPLHAAGPAAAAPRLSEAAQAAPVHIAATPPASPQAGGEPPEQPWSEEAIRAPSELAPMEGQLRDAPVHPPSDPGLIAVNDADEAPPADENRPLPRLPWQVSAVAGLALVVALIVMGISLFSGGKAPDQDARTYSDAAQPANVAAPPVSATTAPDVAAPPPQSAIADADLLRPTWISLAGGSVTLGDANGQPDEQPRRTVSVAAVQISRNEITVGQYRQFVLDSGYRNPVADHYPCESAGGRFPDWEDPGYGQTDDYPVVCVSAVDAAAFAAWLSARTGQHLRLPTEAEWEYAARAGSNTHYWWGERYDSQYASCAGCAVTRTAPQAVGSRPKNAWGLADTSGNVAEWTCTAYAPYSEGQPGQCVEGESLAARAVRGGSWRQPVDALRSAARSSLDPQRRNAWTGFRLVRDGAARD
jgi:formylglycine-generating enzyme required for sulfatase activity